PRRARCLRRVGHVGQLRQGGGLRGHRRLPAGEAAGPVRPQDEGADMRVRPGGRSGSRSPWRGRIGFGLVALGFLVLAPATLSDFGLNLLAKYLCYAIIAVGIGLAWGQGGMLTLGQGVFFGLGGYAMGMYLKLRAAGPGKVPDFMSWSGVEKLPLLWRPFRSAWVALPAAILVPVAVAAALGALVFRRRVRGA